MGLSDVVIIQKSGRMKAADKTTSRTKDMILFMFVRLMPRLRIIYSGRLRATYSVAPGLPPL